MAPRTRPLAARIWEKIDQTTTPDGCWLWTRATRKGYGLVGAPGNKMVTVSRWILEQRIGRPLKRTEVARHTCDVKLCCRPTHIIVGTRRDNSADASERGLLLGNHTSRGGRAPQVLTDEQVVAIRVRYATTTASSSVIAAEFGISPGHVRNLACGRFRPAAGGPFTRRITDDTEAEEAA